MRENIPVETEIHDEFEGQNNGQIDKEAPAASFFVQ